MRVLRPLVLSLLLVLGGGITALSAQNREVSGKVLDANQQPLVGVAVLVDGTTKGVTTSENGTFKIQVPSGEAVLQVTCLGYLPQKVTVPSSRNSITIYLQEDAIMLDATVVIGYGTQKKVNLTGAVATVGSKELENRVTHSLGSMLQGSVAGLNITTSSGKPGSTPAINIRGVNSINSADPLVLIDGVVGDLNRVNPNDVESISVIKDASAAAVYGARAAFGVILVTTKNGSAQDGKATVRYSGRFGWEEATTSTDYENRGYWSVYTVNKFWQADSGTNYVKYNDHDMQQLLARVNDRTEHPDRPWVVEEIRNGRKQWVYYGNYDWWDMLFQQRRPVQQHNISLSGGTKDIKYLVSGAYDRQEGIQRAHPDVYNKYNLRAKLDFRINRWATLSNNTSFFSSNYKSLGDGSVDNTIAYSARHALANFPMKNPDGSWLYSTPYLDYKIANGRHILLNEGTHRNVDRSNDFSNTTRLVITPFKTLSITGDFTYRLYQNRNTSRSSAMNYREYPDGPLLAYDTGAGMNQLDEVVQTRNYYSANVYANYDETFGEAHHVSATAGFNYETWSSKNVSVAGINLSSINLDDLNLATGSPTEGAYGGGQNEYALAGFFARINYDYKGNRGYWSVYTVNKFWQADSGTNYVKYNDHDMQQLLARVNDRTEHPDRPWVVEEIRNGRKQWVYYGNYDWWDMLFQQRRPVQQHNISLSGGTKDIKYLVSGAYDRQEGIQRAHPDVYNKYNLRAKLDFRINRWATLSNNTSFFSSNYKSLGDGSVDNTIAYSARHALANFPMKNPDGSWLYSTPYLDYKIANGRHILLNEGTHRNVDRSNDFSNTTRLVITPFKTLSITGDFTYRLYQNRNTSRSSAMNYREYPDGPLLAYDTGAGMNQLDEVVQTRNYYSANVYANYDETFGEAHHVSATAGFNYETWSSKNVSVAGINLSSINLDDLNLATGSPTEGAYGGGQNEYALAGFFARINYDYKGRYLFEVSGRYDGSSRFAPGNRWGLFPSASAGWRISEEPFFGNAKDLVDNLKLRASFGSLGNQNVSSYYTYMRLITNKDFSNYTFDGSIKGKYSSLGAPVASDLTWETAQQWDLGLDLTMLNNRLNFTGDVYIRDTKDMLTDGMALPGVYGADSPSMNSAELRTKGYELSVSWRDQFKLAGKPFEYSVGFNLSDYKSVITKYDNNPNKSLTNLTKGDYYVGMEIGEIWGFKTDGFFKTTEEAQAYAKEVDLSYSTGRLTGGWQAGDLKFVDLDGNGVWGVGNDTVDKPGDRTILGNSLPTLSYGINASIRWMGFDASVFFQGTGNHYWYPHGEMMPFWGCYSYPYLSYLPTDFLGKVWAEDNPNSYFPRARAYSSSGGYLSKVNDRYLQNIRYLRLKNLTVGYTIPATLTKKAGIDQIRIYFSGENLCYWSPLKKNSKYVDPEAAINRSGVNNNAYYPWAKTFMFGIDITF